MNSVRFSAGLVALGVALALTGGAAAQTYRPTFHPDQLKGPPAGRVNEVLVVGSPHLAQMGDAVKAEMLAPLLDRLAAWAPEVIAIENVSGLQCDAMRRYPQRYAVSISDYCEDFSHAGQQTGLDVPAANAEAERLLSEWPAAPTPEQRRRLAAVFLAAGEPTSALVQWLRLAPAERREGEGLDATLVAQLNTQRDSINESDSVAAVLAARLGLERVWSVDDHSADRYPADIKGFVRAIRQVWNNPANEERKAAEAPFTAGLSQPDGLLNLYRYYNSAEAQRLAYEGDFGAAQKDPSPEGFGRMYLAAYETRNLRMVANMRDVMGVKPGVKMLTLVGASHKGYYEAYLNQMHDVVLADVDQVLR
ncbi:DUF5694 domain-containing protein [Brevundimonas bullata]|uniref:DUF5694 domain-containing protein n=1 Tax=Brevundimonas bullata TaxID=13160 RepID=UPI000E0A8319|nr:DUF5694 domain-containing protein [Brevundimonas bullata]WQE35993.1 DUF5694 domain-containing protein [Brevundimonas bullata]